MEFLVSLDAFDGPLDLMLHLIRENKLDIFDLDVSLLCEQYIRYIHAMETMHLEVASEYMEELAGLVEFKSRKLLPRNEAQLEENYEEDQRQKLVSRLLEYQRYKEAGQLLKERFEQREQMLPREQASLVQEWSRVQEGPDYSGVSASALYQTMRKVLRRHQLLHPLQTQVSVREISIEERMDQLLEKTGPRPVSFESLLDDCHSLHEIIITFLAILAGVHAGVFHAFLSDNDSIWVRKEETDEQQISD